MLCMCFRSEIAQQLTCYLFCGKLYCYLIVSIICELLAVKPSHSEKAWVNIMMVLCIKFSPFSLNYFFLTKMSVAEWRSGLTYYLGVSEDLIIFIKSTWSPLPRTLQYSNDPSLPLPPPLIGSKFSLLSPLYSVSDDGSPFRSSLKPCEPPKKPLRPPLSAYYWLVPRTKKIDTVTTDKLGESFSIH